MTIPSPGDVGTILAAAEVWFQTFIGLISEGCDVVTVQRALGHSSATTTPNTYSHLWPTAEDRTCKAAAAIMETSVGILADAVRTNATQKASDLRKHPLFHYSY
jgi:hypothetical protein